MCRFWLNNYKYNKNNKLKIAKTALLGAHSHMHILYVIMIGFGEDKPSTCKLNSHAARTVHSNSFQKIFGLSHLPNNFSFANLKSH